MIGYTKLVLSLALLLISNIAYSQGAEQNKEKNNDVGSDKVMAIINQANLAALYPGDDASAQARMLIFDKRGNQQLRQFSIIRKDRNDGGDQDILLRFSKPSDVRGTMLLVAKHLTANDDRWLYLPALDLVKRISAGDKRTSFVGSHFFYEDISGRNINDDNFSLLKETLTSYRISAVPKDPNSVEFASYILTIDKQSKLPMSIKYLNHQGKKYRKVEALTVKKIQGNYTVTQSKATDLINGSYTLLQFRRISYDNQIPSAVFSERSLRTPPKKWLK